MPVEYSVSHKKTSPDTLSICVIVKNEAELLARCLNSIKSAADEIVVVDTGSTDNTVEIAKSCGANVLCTQWRDDFAWARNLSIQNAHGCWILWLDADDVVPPESIPLLNKLKLQPPDRVFGFTIRNQRPGNTGSEFIQARMFPNRHDIYFERRIHEQVMPSALRLGMKMETRSDIVIEHHGYADPATMKKKALRNVKLLISDYNENVPDSVTTVEIADSYQLIEEMDNAKKWYEKTLAIKDCEKITPAIAGHAHLGLGNILNMESKFDQAIEHLMKAHSLSPWRPDVLYSLAVSFEQNGQPDEAVDCLHKILSLKPQAGQVGVDFRASRIKAYLRLIRLLTELNRMTEAADVVTNALSVDLNRPEIYNAAGKFLLKCNRLLDALRIFEQSILLVKEGNLEAYIGLCVIYVKADKKQNALSTIETLKNDFSENAKYRAFSALVKGEPLSPDDSETLLQLRREFFNVF